MYSTKNILFSAVLMLYTSVTLAETYYVSPTGTAAWSQCTNISTPCGGKTAAINAQAGDLIYFRGGNYYPHNDPVTEWSSRPDSLKYEALPWNPQNSGTETNPIVFKAYPGETPNIVDNIWSGALGVANRSWIIFDGFQGTVVDSVGETLSLVMFNNASNCIIRNSNLIGTRKGGHQNSAIIWLERSQGITIEHNRIHDMNGYAPGDPGYIEEANNATGIINFYSNNVLIKNNDIYNNYYGIWDKDTEQNNQYINNHIWGGNDEYTRCESGIQINNQLDEFGISTGATANNNVIRNCAVGIFVYDGVGTNNDVAIYNNTIVDTDYSNNSGIFITESSVGANVYNNIIYGYPIQVRYYTPLNTRIALSDYNIFYSPTSMVWNVDFSTNYSSISSWTTATGFDYNSQIVDPLFVNIGGTNPEDYKLASNSPAIGAGMNNLNIGAYPDGNASSIGANFVRPVAPILLSDN